MSALTRTHPSTTTTPARAPATGLAHGGALLELVLPYAASQPARRGTQSDRARLSGAKVVSRAWRDAVDRVTWFVERQVEADNLTLQMEVDDMSTANTNNCVSSRALFHELQRLAPFRFEALQTRGMHKLLVLCQFAHVELCDVHNGVVGVALGAMTFHPRSLDANRAACRLLVRCMHDSSRWYALWGERQCAAIVGAVLSALRRFPDDAELQSIGTGFLARAADDRGGCGQAQQGLPLGRQIEMLRAEIVEQRGLETVFASAARLGDAAGPSGPSSPVELHALTLLVSFCTDHACPLWHTDQGWACVQGALARTESPAFVRDKYSMHVFVQMVASLVYMPGAVDRVVDAGGIEACMRILHAVDASGDKLYLETPATPPWPYSAYVQYHLCIAFARIARHATVYARRLAEYDGFLAKLCSVISTAPCVDAQSAACKALCALASADDADTRFVHSCGGLAAMASMARLASPVMFDCGPIAVALDRLLTIPGYAGLMREAGIPAAMEEGDCAFVNGATVKRLLAAMKAAPDQA